MNRRELIKLAGKCALCLGGTSILSACKTASPIFEGATSTQGEIVVLLTKLSELGTPNLLIRHPESRFPVSLLEFAPGNFSACLMRCSHQQCETVYAESQYICPCHGASFTHTGTVTKKPAIRNLTTYPVEVNGSELRILLS